VIASHGNRTGAHSRRKAARWAIRPAPRTRLPLGQGPAGTERWFHRGGLDAEDLASLVEEGSRHRSALVDDRLCPRRPRPARWRLELRPGPQAEVDHREDLAAQGGGPANEGRSAGDARGLLEAGGLPDLSSLGAGVLAGPLEGPVVAGESAAHVGRCGRVVDGRSCFGHRRAPAMPHCRPPPTWRAGRQPWCSKRATGLGQLEDGSPDPRRGTLAGGRDARNAQARRGRRIHGPSISSAPGEMVHGLASPACLPGGRGPVASCYSLRPFLGRSRPRIGETRLSRGVSVRAPALAHERGCNLGEARRARGLPATRDLHPAEGIGRGARTRCGSGSNGRRGGCLPARGLRPRCRRPRLP